MNSNPCHHGVHLIQVGFLPILAHSVTTYETMYTSLINFQNVLNQLTQSQIVVFCDERVYHIAREIILQRPDEFSGIVLCLGSFHMIKAFLACIRKYLSGSGHRTRCLASTLLNQCSVDPITKGLLMAFVCLGNVLLGYNGLNSFVMMFQSTLTS